MDGEILGEIVGGLAEAAINSRDDDKKGCGCLIFIGIIAIVAILLILWNDSHPQPVKHDYIRGKIVYKLDKDEVLLESVGSKKVYHISHELYLNKKEGDSLCIMR